MNDHPPIFREVMELFVDDLFAFTWDTKVPEVTEPWTHRESMPIKDAMKAVTGITDTSVLFQKMELLELLEAGEDA
jgi:hypothetical protein